MVLLFESLNIIFYAVAGVVGIGIGVLLATTIMRNALTKKSNQLLEEAKEKGEVIKKDKILQAKEKFLQMKSDYEKETNEKKRELQKVESRVQQQQQQVNQRNEELNRKANELNNQQQKLTTQQENLTKKQAELDKIHEEQKKMLESISGLTVNEANGLTATRSYSNAVLQAKPVFFIESAILYEAGLDELCDRIIIVDAPEDIRIARTIARDYHGDATPENINKVRARIRAQQHPLQGAGGLHSATQSHHSIILINDGSASISDLADTILHWLQKS